MRIRNYISYLNYGFKYKQINVLSLLLNLIILIVALINIQDILKYSSILIIFALFFLNIVWQVIGTFSDLILYFKRVSLYEKRINLAPDKILVSDKEQSLGFEKIVIGQNIIIMSKLTNAFCQAEIEPGCRIENNQLKRVQEQIRINFPALVMFLKCRFQLTKSNGTIFNNQRKLCLAGDIESGLPVSFCKGFYYNTHITNMSYFTYLLNTDGQEIYSPYFALNGYKIPNLGASEMGNQIGLSTLAITSDGYVVCLWQQIISNSSPGLLVPTGSGSADWKDYNADGFFPTIITAANRELYEEIGYPKHYDKHNIAKTKIIGFFRWMNMAGKPEFICISKLNIHLNQIKPYKKEQLPRIMPEYIWASLKTSCNIRPNMI